ncbi:MAG: DNA/RNA non-specific endonuclease [Oscillospiraceae bacterium]|nr:DNA/RNA non-specific endonuclease [Oscillospiraceae bacterium]
MFPSISETGVPLSISDFDAKNKDVLRQKLNFAATKVRNGDATTDANRNVLAKIGDQIYNNIAVNPKSHTYKHGNWAGKEIKTENEVFNGKPLAANTSYVCGENNYIYQTDGSGRIQNATGVLMLKQHEGRKGMPNKQTPGKLKGDDAGHIFADMFGGSPKLLNLVSENAHVNRSDHKKVEMYLKKALENEQVVYVDYDIHYSKDSVRPDKFTITYYNGKKDEYGTMKPISIDILNPEPTPKKRKK